MVMRPENEILFPDSDDVSFVVLLFTDKSKQRPLNEKYCVFLLIEINFPLFHRDRTVVGALEFFINRKMFQQHEFKIPIIYCGN